MEAIVLAGGLGTRLRSVVSALPKCMAPITAATEVKVSAELRSCRDLRPLHSLRPLPQSAASSAGADNLHLAGPSPCPRPGVDTSADTFTSSTASVPFLYYLLEELGRQGVSRVILSVGYLREAVMEWVEAGDWPFEIEWAVEEQPLGTGGGIRLALSKAREERVLVLNGDSFLQVPSFAELLEVDATIALALKPMRDFNRYGSVVISPDGRVTAFREKAPCREGLINGGVYALDRRIFEGMALPEKFSFEEAVLQPMAAEGKVAGLVTDGYFIDIGIPEDYARAQRELPELQRVLSASRAVMASDAETLLLDRDGVINRLRPGDYVKSWDEFAFLPGVLGCLKEWARKFPRILVVTNQRGVGRGLMGREALEGIHERMVSEIVAAGGRIDGIYVSTAVSDDDPTRKPNPGLFAAACRDFPAIDPSRTLLLGDSDSDAAFARNCGVRFVRI